MNWNNVLANPTAISKQNENAAIIEGSPNDEFANSWLVTRAIGFPIAWATIILQFVVIPFYNKRETLHKDFMQRKKFAMAHIETSQLIPALAQMFTMATDGQKDKRKRPEPELEELLLSSDFAPNLDKAQKAMSEIDSIELNYAKLKSASSTCWKLGLFNILVTIIAPTIYLFFSPHNQYTQWLFWIACVVWIVTVVVVFQYVFSIHRRIGLFLDSLEATESEETN